METVIAILLGLILCTLLGIHKTLCESQSIAMADANEQIDWTKCVVTTLAEWDAQGMPEQRNEEIK